MAREQTEPNGTYLIADEINTLIESGKLVIRPLLETTQVNGISIDFRLGTDFLVTIQGREPYINASLNNNGLGNAGSFFQMTRRRLGETFLLHPNQTVLASSLEYIKLPSNVFAVLSMRSSYSRLGLTISSTLQPGYCGCISLELTNTNKNPLNLTIGACLFQASLGRVDGNHNYFHAARKYYCQVRPIITMFNEDNDLRVLKNIWERENHVEQYPLSLETL